MTEQLRLEASLKDAASPAVRRLKKEIEAVRQTPGMVELTKWFGKFEEGASEFVRTGGDAAGVINAMGIGGLTAAASIATMVAQFKELGDRTLAMKELGREVGLSVDEVNAFAHAGQHFGVGADVMQGALNHLASQMPHFRRGLGPMFAELSRWPDLIAKLKKEGTEDQIKDIFAFLGQAKFQNEPQLQKQVLESIFGSGDEMERLFAQGAKGFLAELDKMKRTLGPVSPELLKQAQDFRDATIGFNNAIETFELSAGPAFLKEMTAIVKEAEDFLEAWNKGTNKGADKSPDHQDHRTWGQALGNATSDAESAAGWLWDKFSKATEDSPKAGVHKSSFEGSSNALLQRTALTNDAPGAMFGFGIEAAIAAGTKAGFLAAMRELMTGQEVDKPSGPAGLINASYDPDEAGTRNSGPRSRPGGSDNHFGIPPRSHREIPNDGTPFLHQGKIGRGATSAEGRDRASSWLSFFQKPVDQGGLGMPRDKAQAAVAMMQGESGPNLRPDQEVWDVNGPSGGTAQWHDRAGSHDRLSQLKDFAASLQKSWKDVGVQQQFWRKEALGSHSAAFRAMMAAQTPEGTLAAGVAGFEVPRDVAGETRKRLGYLRRLQRDDVAADPRRANGLPAAEAAAKSQQQPGHVRADIHIHGAPHHKATIRSSGAVEAMIHRWPTMTEASDLA